jgi:hypothetical protein
MDAVICITHVLSITAAAIPSCCRPLITHFHNLAAICNCLQASTHFGDKSKIFGGGNCKRKVARSFSLRSVRPNADAELERTCPSTSLEAARIPLKRQQEKLTTSQERRKQIKPSDDALESQWKLFQRSLRKLPCIPKIEFLFFILGLLDRSTCVLTCDTYFRISAELQAQRNHGRILCVGRVCIFHRCFGCLQTVSDRCFIKSDKQVMYIRSGKYTYRCIYV